MLTLYSNPQCVRPRLSIISNICSIYSLYTIYIMDNFPSLLTFLQFPSLWRHFGVHIVSATLKSGTDRPDVRCVRCIPSLNVSGPGFQSFLISIFIPYTPYTSWTTFPHYWHFYSFLVSDVTLRFISCPPRWKEGRIDRMWGVYVVLNSLMCPVQGSNHF